MRTTASALTFAVALILQSTSSSAAGKLTNLPCLDGDSTERASQAKEIFGQLTKSSDPADGVTTEDLTRQANLATFQRDLGAEMRRRSCGFDENARFGTVGEVRSAFATHWFKEKQDVAVPSYIKPGFVALIGTPDTDDMLVIETTEDGFVFKECVADAEPGKRCKAMGNSSVFVPVEDFLKGTSGKKHVLMTILKVLAEATVASVAAISDSTPIPFLIMPAGQITNELVKPEPFNTYKREQGVKHVTEEILLMGKFDAAASKTGIVTRMIPFAKHEDLKDAVLDLVSRALTNEWKQLSKLKGLPLLASSAYAAQYGFHQQAIDLYTKEKEAQRTGGAPDKDK